jgi:hypothetical protein
MYAWSKDQREISLSVNSSSMDYKKIKVSFTLFIVKLFYNKQDGVGEERME